MVLITFKRLKDFIEVFPDAKTALYHWQQVVTHADWKSIGEVRSDFNSVDYVGNDRFVFNVKGNNYRLVAMIHFSTRTVYVRFIGTHKAYDKIDADKV
jgi:mRNA interferase HigB